MRPAQNNKRMRGRPNNNRKGPNPLTRSYESSGPDVKIRGTAHHISEKYLQLARDAQTSGDPVMAESYLQHAEHYYRLIAAAQQAQQQGLGAYPQMPGEALVEEAEDDGDFGGMPDRFASPPERFFQPPQPPSFAAQPQPGPAQPANDRPFRDNGERQVGERQVGERQTGERQMGDRQGTDRQPLPRPERGPRPDRPFQDRNYRDREYQAYPDKPYQDQRSYQDRNGRGRDQENRANRGRNPRDYRNETSIRVDQREETRSAEPGIESNGLPAFITAPVRVQPESHDTAAPIETLTPMLGGQPEAEGGANGFLPRPRRRRRSKAEMGIDDVQGGGEDGNATGSIQD
jgi:Domain of unknown function (DUF4167)